MESYKINDLVIGSYSFKTAIWFRGKKRQTISAHKSVLYKLNSRNYKDVISNSLIPKEDVLGVKSFIAQDELLSKMQIIYIFNALEELKLVDNCDTFVSYEEFTPLDIAKDMVSKTTEKVKKIGSKFKK